MRVASAGLVYWVAWFFLLETKARILGLTELKSLLMKMKEESEKAGLSLQSKTGNHSHPQMIWGAR